MRQALALEPRRSALILVDLQEEQRHVPNYAVAEFASVIANAKALLSAARSRELLTVHAAFRRDFDAVPPRPLEPLSPGGGPAFSDKNSPLIAICSEVGPAKGEPVIHKNDASAFSEGELEHLLRRDKIEWLIVCGVWTEACVAATVRDAIAGGFRVLLVKDACGSGTRAMHQTGILNLANRLSGGAVASTETALRLLAGEKADVWIAERPAPILFGYDDAEKLYNSL